MNIRNSATQSSLSTLKNDIEPLRGGFGESDDHVGSSYHAFYQDSYHATETLTGIVNRENACCDRVRNIDPDKLCRRGNDLIRQVKSYPRV